MMQASAWQRISDDSIYLFKEGTIINAIYVRPDLKP